MRRTSYRACLVHCSDSVRSGVPGVRWDAKSRGWVAKWNQNKKSGRRIFGAATYGYKGALRKAIELRKQMMGDYTGDGDFTLGVRGVKWQPSSASQAGPMDGHWVVKHQPEGADAPVFKTFSTEDLGFERAKELAVLWRKKLAGELSAEQAAELRDPLADDPIPEGQDHE